MVHLDATQELGHPQHQCDEWHVVGAQYYLLDQERMIDSWESGGLD